MDNKKRAPLILPLPGEWHDLRAAIRIILDESCKKYSLERLIRTGHVFVDIHGAFPSGICEDIRATSSRDEALKLIRDYLEGIGLFDEELLEIANEKIRKNSDALYEVPHPNGIRASMIGNVQGLTMTFAMQPLILSCVDEERFGELHYFEQGRRTSFAFVPQNDEGRGIILKDALIGDYFDRKGFRAVLLPAALVARILNGLIALKELGIIKTLIPLYLETEQEEKRSEAVDADKGASEASAGDESDDAEAEEVDGDEDEETPDASEQEVEESEAVDGDETVADNGSETVDEKNPETPTSTKGDEQEKE